MLFRVRLSEVELARGWPERSGKVILQLALRQLARHYGLITDEAKSNPAGKVRGWVAAGFRPKI